MEEGAMKDVSYLLRINHFRGIKKIDSFISDRIFMKLDYACDIILWEKISELIYWRLDEEISQRR